MPVLIPEHHAMDLKLQSLTQTLDPKLTPWTVGFHVIPFSLGIGLTSEYSSEAPFWSTSRYENTLWLFSDDFNVYGMFCPAKSNI